MAQQPQQQGDNGMAPVWIGALAIITMYVIWYAGHRHIVSFIFYLNILQAELVNFFIGRPQLADEIYLMKTLDPASVDVTQLLLLTRLVGEYVRYIVIAVLALLAFFLYRGDLLLKFCKAHNMFTLRAQEQYNWPAITPIVKENLVSQDINIGPWAMAMTPMEFARKYQLLKKDDVLLDNPVPGQEFTAGIRRGDAKRVFTLQLGPYWSDFEHCPPYARALAAVFMARMNRDRDAADNILAVLDKTVSQGKPNYGVATATLRKYQGAENVREVTSKHAYLLTVLAALIQHAREDGVVPSAEFLWLKTIDRRLWYVLNCVGRQTPYAEVAGPFAHWRAEQAMGRRSLVPMIDEAINALEIAIKEVKLSPKELQGLQP